jgi:putative acyl-CoA dehydrogenase
MRLKDKLADRANASSEVEYNNAYGVMIGKEGKG